MSFLGIRGISLLANDGMVNVGLEGSGSSCNDAPARRLLGTTNRNEICVADFTHEEIDAVYRVMAMRRDMRHFSSAPLDPNLLARLLYAAHLAPSVGLMQPWRFIHIRDRALRSSIHALVEHERILTAEALGTRDEEFMRLKVEGILECGDVLVAGLAPGRERHVFGRRTMPQMDLASVACAIQNLWLAARVENVGLGWVSLFEPESLRTLLRMPLGSQPVAVLCLGYVDEFYAQPLLEITHWAERRELDGFVHTNYWDDVEGVDNPDG